MRKNLFTGVCTALVTPFENGKVNLSMLRKLLDRQLDAGIPAIVICGTTGESPALSDEEKLLLFREAKKYVGDQALIIAGTGSNCTAHAVDLSSRALDQGVDGLLVVTPYYNKATESGLLEHYRKIAEAVDIPIILYNVPSRTSVDISVSVCRQLAELENIVGIKEASPDPRKMAHLRAACPESFSIWSGNDDLILPMMALGAAGLISVASNALPGQMKAITDDIAQGKWNEAQSRFKGLLPFLDALFAEVNPIPIKKAMELMGYYCGPCRLPLTELSIEHTAMLRQILSDLPENF